MFYDDVGRFALFHGKFTWSGTIRAIEGKWLVLDHAFMHFRCDAEVRIRNTSYPPISLGDGFKLNSDYIEGVVFDVKWKDPA